jgi:hypothetical protein
VPKHADGTFNIDELMAFVERGAPRENKMEPALRHVVRELAPEVQGALASLGLETTGDFHHFCHRPSSAMRNSGVSWARS